MKLISFYADHLTSNGYYESWAKALSSKCKDLGIDPHIEKLQGNNEYWSNTRMKPAFILKCIDKYKCPILWIDVDTDLKLAPKKPNDNIDFAACKRHHSPQYGVDFFAHALYFNYNEKAMALLHDWKDFVEKPKRRMEVHGGGKGDHECLLHLMNASYLDKLSFTYLDDFCQWNISGKSIRQKKRLSYNDPLRKIQRERRRLRLMQ